MAVLHAACFTIPRPWSAAEIDSLLQAAGCFVLTNPNGFVIGRVVAREAELLTLAVSPDARRQGIARNLCTMFNEQAQNMGAATAFLEVASDNAAAQALYASLGWVCCGVRRGYYAPGIDAMVMQRVLHQVTDLSQESG